MKLIMKFKKKIFRISIWKKLNKKSPNRLTIIRPLMIQFPQNGKPILFLAF